jgi:hypothetical protein
MSQLTVDVGDDATPRKLRRASTFATKTKTEPKTPSTPRFGHSQSLAPRERWERAATVSALVQPFAMVRASPGSSPGTAVETLPKPSLPGR